MATQQEIDALTGRLNEVGLQLVEGLGEVSNEIARLNDLLEQGETVDLSALSAKVDEVASVAQALDDVVPDALPPEGVEGGEV